MPLENDSSLDAFLLFRNGNEGGFSLWFDRPNEEELLDVRYRCRGKIWWNDKSSDDFRETSNELCRIEGFRIWSILVLAGFTRLYIFEMLGLFL